MNAKLCEALVQEQQIYPESVLGNVPQSFFLENEQTLKKRLLSTTADLRLSVVRVSTLFLFIHPGCVPFTLFISV